MNMINLDILKYINLLDTKHPYFNGYKQEFIEKGFFLLNETDVNNVSIRLKLYSYRPYATIQRKLLWHGQNHIPTVEK